MINFFNLIFIFRIANTKFAILVEFIYYCLRYVITHFLFQNHQLKFDFINKYRMLNLINIFY